MCDYIPKELKKFDRNFCLEVGSIIFMFIALTFLVVTYREVSQTMMDIATTKKDVLTNRSLRTYQITAIISLLSLLLAIISRFNVNIDNANLLTDFFKILLSIYILLSLFVMV
jgi:hypothetical protein